MKPIESRIEKLKRMQHEAIHRYTLADANYKRAKDRVERARMVAEVAAGAQNMPWVQVNLLGQGTGEGEKVVNNQPFCIEKRYDMIDAKEMMKQPGVDDAITKVLVKMKINAALGNSDLATMLSMASGIDSRFAGLYAAEDPNASEVVIDSLSTIAALCVLCMVKVGKG